MGGHGDCRIEIGGSPLHIEPLQGIGVVAYPEFVEPWHNAVTCSSPAACAGLDGKVRVFLAHPVEHLLKSAMVLDEEVVLILEVL